MRVETNYLSLLLILYGRDTDPQPQIFISYV